MKNLLVLFTGILILVGCGERVVEKQTAVKPETVSTQSFDTEYFIVACAIVHDENGNWQIVNDGGHQPLNCTGLSVYQDYLVVSYGRTASKVLSISTDADDTFAQNGYFMGASVGLSAVYLQFSKEINGVITPIDQDEAVVNGGEGILIFGIMKI